MGFRLDRSYRLKFEGTALEGAEVHLRNTSVATLLIVSERNNYEHSAELAEMLAAHVISWNLEDAAGEPVKLTADAILAAMESAVFDHIMTEWYRAARGITAPLEQPSSDGEPLAEESIPMVALSPPPSM